MPIGFMLIILGLILGSFINALAWRLYMHKDWIRGRSECTHCNHQLGPLDLVPLLSWVFLKGKCRYCRKKIDDNPLVELSLPILFIISYIFWPVPLSGRGLFEFILWLCFLVGFLLLAVYDLRWFLLPNRIVFPLIGLGLAQLIVVVCFFGGGALAVRDAVVGVTVTSGIFYVLFQLSKGAWIGGGDVKLGVVLGLLVGGLLPGLLLLFIASITGMLASLPLVATGKADRKTHIPFGPFLILGLVVVKLWGGDVIDWYTNLLS